MGVFGIDWATFFDTVPPLALFFSIFATLLLLSLPKQYDHFDYRSRTGVSGKDFTDEDKKNAKQSGYTFFQAHKTKNGTLPRDCSVNILVLGDIGHSPRMQNHALSIASRGGHVSLIGFVESEPHPDILAHRLITVVPLSPPPSFLRTTSKLLFLATAPLKVFLQCIIVFRALSYRTRATRWMLVQNPPAIPALLIAQIVCFLRNTRLVIDWHNFSYSILALRLSPSHPLVKFSKWYEQILSQSAHTHFTVTNAMARVLEQDFHIKEALPLHDRPAAHFQPLSKDDGDDFLATLEETGSYAPSLRKNSTRLLVSPTSWTPDEDFSLLLDALVHYSAACTTQTTLPNLLVVITGKGPQKAHYLARISQLEKEKKLLNVKILTAWLSPADYASLLASADLGISLHTSSSGVDLPMKVVDMFGCGLPVAGWSKFEAWPELVTEGVNGKGFGSAEELTGVLREIFGDGGKVLEVLRKGVEGEVGRRWDAEWSPVAGKLLELED